MNHSYSIILVPAWFDQHALDCQSNTLKKLTLAVQEVMLKKICSVEYDKTGSLKI